MDGFENVIIEVFNLKGLSILDSPRVFIACLADMSGAQWQRENALMKRNCDQRLLTLFADERITDKASANYARASAIALLRDDFGLAEIHATDLADSLFYAVCSYKSIAFSNSTDENGQLIGISEVSASPSQKKAEEALQEPTTPKQVGWGPSRQTFTNESPAPYPTFNSITNNSGVGDERNFCRIRECGSKKPFGQTVHVVPGKRYEVYVYYQNDTTVAGSGGTAYNTRVWSSFPAQMTPGAWFGINAKITSSNTNPPAVWDGCDLWSSVPIQLRYVPESATLHRRGSEEISLPPGDLFNRHGALIGCDKLDGKIPGDTGKDSSGYVTYVIEAELWIQEGNGSGGCVEKLVSSDGEVFGKHVVAAPGDEVTFKLIIRNTGDIKIFNTTIRDSLPGMTLVPDSAELRANESNVSSKLSGNISRLGCKLGSIGAGNSVLITYRATIAETINADKTAGLTSTSSLTYDGFHSPGITAHDSASIRIASRSSSDYFTDPEVLANLVDALITSKYKALPPFSGELAEIREKAIQELDERIGDAVFGKLTPAQDKELNALLDQDECTEQDYEDFFDRVGLDIVHIIREVVDNYVKEFLE